MTTNSGRGAYNDNLMPKDIDSYIKTFNKDDQRLLQELREIIHSVAKFEEGIAYSMPALRYRGKPVACFAMYAKHLGFYPYSGNIIKSLAKDLKEYKTSVGAIQLPKDKKLPRTLIRKVVKARMKEIDAKLKKAS